MSRSFTYQALTLRVKPSGESNREAWFLTAEEGIVRATVFGGPKSRLRARVAPYHEGTLWIYHDPVKDSRKVSDYDVRSYRAGIRELYERAMASAAVAETILASHGGGAGGGPGALKLAGTVLDALEMADAPLCSRLGVYFLWHWTQILGEKPDLSACAACGRELSHDEALWYIDRKEALFCGNCAARPTSPNGYPAKNPASSSLRLGPGAISWLKAIESLPASGIKRVSLDGPSLEQAGSLVQAILALSIGQKLPTWDNI